MSVQRGSDPPARPLRVGYLSGPSDAAQVYQDMMEGKAATYFGTNYMKQFLLLMLDLKAQALVETWFGDRASRRQLGPFLFDNVPDARSSGLIYHLAQIFRQAGVLGRLFRYRPDLVVLTGKQGYWWVLAPLRLAGTRFVASFHCTLWPRFGRMKLHQRVLLWLDRTLMLRRLSAVVSTSQAITDQFIEAAGAKAKRIPIFQHLPTYDPGQFSDIRPAEWSAGDVFRVLFTGRIEANKGVFDILSIARELHRTRPGEFAFHLCGDGSAMTRLRDEVDRLGLSEVICLHGYCTPDRLERVMSDSHVVIVPTRSDFEAGFEMTCAEAVLSGRPLVTSAVCPAIDYLRDAAIEVSPDDVGAYRDAIERLRDDRGLFLAKRAACQNLARQFYDESKSWDFAMRLALARALPRQLAEVIPQSPVTS